MPWIRAQAGQQGLELPGQLAPLLAGENGQQGLLVPEQPVYAALDERVAGRGQGYVAEPAVGVGTLAADQALALGPGHPLGDGAGADQALPGQGARGEPVRRARAAQGGQQVQGGGVDAEAGQRPAAFVGE